MPSSRHSREEDGRDPLLLDSRRPPAERQLAPALVGGKAASLFRLQGLGLQVPPFVVLTCRLFERLEERPALLDEVLEQVLAAVEGWGGGPVAVRSSASLEDAPDSSFAGILESSLNVAPGELRERVLDCAASLKSPRAEAYLRRKGLEAGGLKAAVIVQRMVEAEKSGVSFSRAPAGNSALVYTEACRGLGEALVSGRTEVDRYWTDRFGRRVRTELAGEGQGTLEPAELEELGRAVLQIESGLGWPCDVEWSFAAGRLQLLQARPITQAFPRLLFYTDTNLVESYPGRTSPLTASFVRRVYATVFRESARLLTGRKTVPPQLDRHYEHLIEQFDGHLYYNLESYYAALLSLPGGEKNLENWHRMIGGKPAADLDLSAFWRPSAATSLVVLANLGRIGLFQRRVFARFYRQADAAAARLDADLAACRDAPALARLLLGAFFSVEGFALTILNDVLIMAGVRALLGLLARGGFGEEALPSLVRTRRVVESLAPLRALDAVLAGLGRAPGTLRLLQDAVAGWDGADPAALWETAFGRIAASGEPALAEELRLYLARFGDRSFEELKLESMTFAQSPELFVEFLGWQLENAARGRPAPVPPDDEGLEARVLASLSFAQRPLLRAALGFTREAIATRERCRLIRGRFYGWWRAGFLRFAAALRAEAPEAFAGLRTAELFGLTLADLEAYAAGGLSAVDLADRLRAKAAAPAGVTSWPELYCHPLDPEGAIPPCFPGLERLAAAPSEGLAGTGAAPGVATGEALVLGSPQEAMRRGDLGGRILVTANTDPAWVFLMSQCRGLVSEKGSLLSHTAIIGRELAIPTVVGVRNATRLIPDGALIEIDGTTGRITLLERARRAG